MGNPLKEKFLSDRLLNPPIADCALTEDVSVASSLAFLSKLNGDLNSGSDGGGGGGGGGGAVCGAFTDWKENQSKLL